MRSRWKLYVGLALAMWRWSPAIHRLHYVKWWIDLLVGGHSFAAAAPWTRADAAGCRNHENDEK